MLIPVSFLSTYLYCRRKLFLEQTLGYEEPPKEALIKGLIRHELYDKINKAEQGIVTSIEEETPLEDLQALYKRNYSAILRKIIMNNKSKLLNLNLSLFNTYKEIWPIVLEETETRANNLFNFIQTHQLFGKELWQALTPKIESEFKISSSNLQLKGVIDQLEKYDNHFIPVELKTGKLPKEGIWPSHRIQLAAYALLLEDQFGIPVKEGFVHYLDYKQKRQLIINPFLKQEVLDLTRKVISLLESSKLPDFCLNKNKCNSCGLKDICYKQKI